MNTMKWLLRREFWEHKGSMLWAPLAAGAAMVLLVTVSIVYSSSVGKFRNNIVHMHDDGGKTTQLVTTSNIGAAFQALPERGKQEAAEMVSNGYLAASAPLFLILAAVVFFYCLGALHDERRDRSILFWKSLPVSDTETVLSKVATAAVVAPLITIAIATFVSLVLLLIVGTAFALHGVNMFGRVLGSPALYLAPFQLLGLLPVYLLWALPTIGWLLLVSSWARSKVFLWAVGTPVILIVIIKWMSYMLGLGLDSSWFVSNVIARGLLGLIPGAWLGLADIDKTLVLGDQNTVAIGSLFTQSWLTLSDPGVWIGAVVGGAMIYGAIRIRRWRDEG